MLHTDFGACLAQNIIGWTLIVLVKMHCHSMQCAVHPQPEGKHVPRSGAQLPCFFLSHGNVALSAMWYMCRETFHLPDDLTEEEKLEPVKNATADPRIRLLNRLYAKKRKVCPHGHSQVTSRQQALGLLELGQHHSCWQQELLNIMWKIVWLCSGHKKVWQKLLYTYLVKYGR